MDVEGESYEGVQGGWLTAMAETARFYRCVFYFMSGGNYKQCPYFADRLQVRTSLSPVCFVLFNSDMLYGLA